MSKSLRIHFLKFIRVACVLICSPAFSQTSSDTLGSITELNIGQSETYQVTQPQSVLKLQTLSIGDNATITFSDDVDRWFVEALDAQIGNNVNINGLGSAGRDGEDAPKWISDSLDCGVGRTGKEGGSGSDGENGVAIQMRLGVSKFGSLKIETSGGHGGQGGSGAKGQNAGQEANCDKAEGGDGGRGGDGGNGGDAGSVRVSLWDARESTNIAHDALANIMVLAQAGEAGLAGEGGAPGKGSEGRYVNRRSLSGNKRWSAGGKNGTQGANGAPGASASAGRVDVEELFLGHATTSPQPIVPQVSAPEQTRNNGASNAQQDEASAEIEAMKKQIEALQKRLDEMEKEN